ncbi:hypothetical protein AB0E63_38730 [Kribbella sp. NPDC026596]|uniref:hypothetical protein n=1 Tax=Kribbella sp. NPDC026596 TaxID=3155122 RepID=UPI0033F00CDF
MSDELLRPTIAAAARSTARPWRLLYLGYVAVLGGILPATWLSFVNSRRLGVSPARRLLIVVIGLTGLVAEILVAGWLFGGDDGQALARLTPVRVIAALAYLVQMRLQLPMERAFQLRGGEHATRFGAGHIVLIGVGVMVEVLIVLVAGS